MEEVRLFKDLAVVFGLAFLLALIANRLRLPTLLAYIGAGLALGPNGFRIVEGAAEVSALGEVGVALLMFAVGVEFSLQQLAAVGRVAIRGGILQTTLTAVIAGGVAMAWGWGAKPAIFLGSLVAISSTMIVIKILAERGETDSLHGRIMLGILIIQDLAVVVMVALMPLLGSGGASPWVTLGKLASVAAYLTLAFLVVRGSLPRLMLRVAQTQSREIFNLSVVGICLVAAMGTYSLGLSFAIGAFIAGLILGESDYNHQIAATIAPLRDLFAMVFFVAIGMMFDLSAVMRNIGGFMLIFALILLVKPVVTGTIVRLFGYSPRTSLLCALGLAQIGEFSFLMAQLGLQQALLSADMYSIIVTVAMASLIVTPFLASAAPGIYRRLTKTSFWRRRIGEDEGPDAVSEGSTMTDHVIICGHSTIYLELVEFLDRKRIPWVVLDDSRTMTQCAVSDMSSCVYGDPSNEALIERLNPGQARAAVVWIRDRMASRMAVRTLRKMNPTLPIVVAVRQEDAVDEILHEGANHIIQPEFEASVEILRYLMLTMGMPLEESHRHIEGIRLNRLYAIPGIPVRSSLEGSKDHLIICGFGRLGRAVSRQLAAAGVPHVAVERDPERARRYASPEVPVLWGDAIKDRVLVQAGVKHARGLVAATDNDSVNMHIILTARRLNAGLELIAYGGHAEAAKNLRAAGANKVYSPYDLGGMRIAASIVSPVAADLLEKIITPSAPGSEVAEIAIEESSPLAGLTLRESQIREKTGAMIFGILRPDGKLDVNPGGDAGIAAGSSLIAVGTKSHLEEVRKLATERGEP